MKLRALAAVIIFLLSGSAPMARDEIQRTMAEELLGLMDIQRNLDNFREQYAVMIERQLAATDIPQKHQKKLVEFQKEVMEFVFEVMSWENLKDKYIDVYVASFTQEELGGLLTFYRSSLGRMFVERQPELLKQMTNTLQEELQGITPQVMAMTEDFYEKLAAEAAEEAEREAELEGGLD